MPSPYIEASKHPEGTKAVEDHFQMSPWVAPLVAPLIPFYSVYKMAKGEMPQKPTSPQGTTGPPL